jgi:hypothetical protein
MLKTELKRDLTEGKINLWSVSRITAGLLSDHSFVVLSTHRAPEGSLHLQFLVFFVGKTAAWVELFEAPIG